MASFRGILNIQSLNEFTPRNGVYRKLKRADRHPVERRLGFWYGTWPHSVLRLITHGQTPVQARGTFTIGRRTWDDQTSHTFFIMYGPVLGRPRHTSDGMVQGRLSDGPEAAPSCCCCCCCCCCCAAAASHAGGSTSSWALSSSSWPKRKSGRTAPAAGGGGVAAGMPSLSR